MKAIAILVAWLTLGCILGCCVASNPYTAYNNSTVELVSCCKDVIIGQMTDATNDTVTLDGNYTFGIYSITSVRRLPI